MKPVAMGVLLFSLIAMVLGVSLSAHNVNAQGCAIMTDMGYAPDFDCDGVIDEFDNCPRDNNENQLDTNRNAIGDICDLVVEEIIVNPDTTIRQGEFAHVTIRMINNRDMAIEGITIALVNKDLGIDASQDLKFIPQGETGIVDFWVKAPKCATTKSYPLSITASFTDPLTGKKTAEAQKETLIIERGAVCGTKDGPLDNTIINVFNKIDLDRGESAIMPITLTNLGDSQERYDLTVDALDGWGSWRIDPAPQVTIVAGHRGEAYLYIQTESHTPAGAKQLMLTIMSGDQKTTVPITVYVRGVQPTGAGFWVFIMQWIVLILLVLLIVIAILIPMRIMRNPKYPNGKDEKNHKVEPYYDDNGATISVGSGAKANHSANAKSMSGKKNAKTTAKTNTGKNTKNVIPTSTTQRRTIAIEPAGKGKLETYY